VYERKTGLYNAIFACIAIAQPYRQNWMIDYMAKEIIKCWFECRWNNMESMLAAWGLDDNFNTSIRPLLVQTWM
jgi:hypothetical protein